MQSGFPWHGSDWAPTTRDTAKTNHTTINREVVEEGPLRGFWDSELGEVGWLTLGSKTLDTHTPASLAKKSNFAAILQGGVL